MKEYVPRITVFIEVLRKDKIDRRIGLLKKGTFRQPFPLTRIEPNTFVEWKIKRGRRGDTFSVEFEERSPFPDQLKFDTQTGERKASIRGRNFVYHVSVTDGRTGEVYTIDHSPILCTDP